MNPHICNSFIPYRVGNGIMLRCSTCGAARAISAAAKLSDDEEKVEITQGDQTVSIPTGEIEALAAQLRDLVKRSKIAAWQKLNPGRTLRA